jgi:hypothetical protein
MQFSLAAMLGACFCMATLFLVAAAAEQQFLVKHPAENIKSFRLHEERHHRKLSTYVTVKEGDENTPYTIKHKQLKNHIPFAGGDTTHGMMIDA